MIARLSLEGTKTGRAQSKKPNQSNPPKQEPAKQEPVIIMLDSGAFSAWTKGEEIKIDDYIAYIKNNIDYIDTYVTLDVIPGKQGETRTAEQAEEGARLSYENHKKMQKAGLKPIPVFHRGERWLWLERMLLDREPYIGLSPAVPLVGHMEARRWLDRAFTYLTDGKGKPLAKTHGFAVSSFPLMRRYPWTTCDATSWAQTAAFGSILLPMYRNGQPDYSVDPQKLPVSTVARDKTPPDHITRLGPLMRARVEQFLAGLGMTVFDVANDYEARAAAIVYVMKQFEATTQDITTFQHRVRL